VQLGLKEADTLKSSSVLIYTCSAQSICTQSGWHDAVVIKEMKLNKGVIKLVNEITNAKLRTSFHNHVSKAN